MRIIHATLRALLNAAIDDGVISANPAARLGRHFRLVPSVTTRQEAIKPMTARQLSAFLAAARTEDPRWSPLWLCHARAGLRLGEGLALEWPELDFADRELRVARALSDGEAGTPKSGHGRTVDMSKELVAVQQHLKTDRKAETLRRGWGEVPALVSARRRARRSRSPTSGGPSPGPSNARSCPNTSPRTRSATRSRACCSSRASARSTSSGSSATPRSSSPSTPTAGGSRWGTRPLSTASTEQVVAKW